jgi:hypothetical protein
MCRASESSLVALPLSRFESGGRLSHSRLSYIESYRRTEFHHDGISCPRCSDWQHFVLRLHDGRVVRRLRGTVLVCPWMMIPVGGWMMIFIFSSSCIRGENFKFAIFTPLFGLLI